jgi:glyoxylase-like metal-dependent hydrolase (beta-lactamase superfamily II)
MLHERLMKVIAKGKNYVSFQFGDLQVVALRDGYVDMPTTRLRRNDGSAFASPPAGTRLVGGQLRLSVNAFLIVESQRSVLIDTGASNAWLPTMGGLYAGLDEAGIDRDTITDVALTHTHEDHVSGLIAPDGTDAFPRARQIVVPNEETGVFKGRLARLRDQVTPISDGFRVSDRVTAVTAAGHSPGHTAYEIASSVGHLFAWGDIIHVPSVQFARPEITWEFDSDQSRARTARLALLTRVARPDCLVAGAHLDFPGIGSVVKRGGAFDFEPAAQSDFE